jgi:MscS family membrane protein
MPDFSQLFPDPLFLQQLLYAAGIVVLFAIVARLMLYFLSTLVSRFTRSTNTKLDDTLVASIRMPLFAVIVLIGVYVAAAQLSLPPDWRWFVEGALFVGFTIAITLFFYRMSRDMLDWYLHEKAKATVTTLDETLIPFLRRVLMFLLVAVAAVLIMQYFNVPVTSFVATLGVGSLAVALAAQAVLSDLIAGFFVLLDQRYRIGDRIELVDERVIGDVMDIGLRTTRILTMDHRVVIVPNSMIASRLVINHAFPDPKVRVDLPIGVAYGSDLATVKKVLIEAMQQVEGVYRDRRPDVVMTGFGEHALTLEMRCWINAYGDRPKMVDRINVAAYNALNAAGIEIPFPQRVLRVSVKDLDAIRVAMSSDEGGTAQRALTGGSEAAEGASPS